MAEKRTPFLKNILKNLSQSIDHQSHEKYQNAEKLIQELEKNQKEFISYVVNQLMSPISTIHKHSWSLLTDKKLDEAHRQNAALIHDGVVKLEDLLTAYSKIDHLKTKKIEIDFEPIDLNEIFHELIKEFGFSKRIEIDFKKLPKIFADKEKIKELLSHLIHNALHYSKGKVKLTAKIGSGRHAKEIIIGIHDKGIGIPEKDQAKVFEAFFRAGNNPKKFAGLGLYLSKAIAKKHNGEIWFESVENRGTNFFIAIPIAK